MAMSYVLLLTRLIAEVTSKSTESLVSQPECCMDVLDANSTCPVTNQCSPGCYREWNEDGSSSCIKCKNETTPVVSTYNLTDCRNTGTRGMNFQTNISTVTPFLQNIASVLQPSETASMIPPPTSSVRKPRYVRRERSLVMSASTAMIPSAETRVSNV
ncbi:uncharacterized protein C1orf159 homolog isoform X3 [Chelonia mydas]|uniref:uncharacterized protein C1orf159 homolog isoform X3 n=1 Tax=Chelonia mydas TaxID=8469 RepID=UPI0018A23ABA|nr:uncharacterized protein C1orf159 homolog isoform X3 [Chelonia mydas]XP_043387457.1 uncharacterized protein C1orf159 homolog isoform X3 [Chelonia mydas]